MNNSSTEQLDRVAIENLVVCERAARDGLRWAEMGVQYHPDSTVDISWFKGSGAQFTAASAQIADSPIYTFHELGASAITLQSDRALVDSNCAVHFFSTLDGAEVDIVSFCRLQWRAQRSGAQWLIAGLRSVYIRDLLIPVNPLLLPRLDADLLASFRPSYRYIAYRSARAGNELSADLPGVDRPESVGRLLAGEQQWLRLSQR